MRQNCGKSEKKTTANRYENGEPVASVSAEAVSRAALLHGSKTQRQAKTQQRPGAFAF